MAEGLTLGQFWRLGVRELRCCCLQRDCSRSYPLALDSLIRRFGRERLVVEIARAAKCRDCEAKGAHIEPVGFGLQRGAEMTREERNAAKAFDGIRSHADVAKHGEGQPDSRTLKR